MKTKFFFLLLLVTSYGFSQSVNDYKAVIIPVKFDFVKGENKYRLNTISKFNMSKAGFEAFYSTEMFQNLYNDSCDLLYLDVQKENGFLITKLSIALKDCNGKLIFQSNIGKSKDKDLGKAYVEALNEAFQSIYDLKYTYNGTKTGSQNSTTDVAIIKEVSVVPVPVVLTSKEASTDVNFLFAQPIVNGFQLVDSTPKVVMKVYKTSSPSCYIAEKDTINGVLISKQGEWFFEFYKNNTFFSEKTAVKF